MPLRINNPTWLNLLSRFGISAAPVWGLSELVMPVTLVDSEINIPVSVVPPLYGVPSSAGVSAVPAANTRLADTGALAAGNWTFTLWMTSNDVNRYNIRHRNAADAADIWAYQWIQATNANDIPPIQLRLTMGVGERLVIENAIVGAGGSVYSAAIFAVAD